MLRIECCNRRIETCAHEVTDAPGSAGRDPDDGFVEPLGVAPRLIEWTAPLATPAFVHCG